MLMDILIRNETAADIDAISAVTEAAFRTCPYSRQTEQFIVHALRKAGVITVSLVAEIDGKVAGHVAFSPVTVSDGSSGWYGLGPVSVLPELQRQGIGKALINKGLTLLKESGANGCMLVGDPDYYRRFGFRNFRELIYEGIPQQYFVVLPFGQTVPRGTVTFHEAFHATSQAFPDKL